MNFSEKVNRWKERQRERGTEGKRDGGIERRRDREMEGQRDGGKERWRDRVGKKEGEKGGRGEGGKGRKNKKIPARGMARISFC